MRNEKNRRLEQIECLSVVECSKLLGGLTPQAIRNYIRQGHIPAVTIGKENNKRRKYLIPLKGLSEALERNKVHVPEVNPDIVKLYGSSIKVGATASPAPASKSKKRLAK